MNTSPDAPPLMDDSALLKMRGYTLGTILGEGSYAKVKSAFSEHLKCRVAVKIIDRRKAPSDFLQKFLPREMDILPLMNHRYIVKTYEIFEIAEGKIYMVMELGAQGDLLEFIRSRGPMPELMARKLFHQLATALKYCHDLDIVHRDLKCENILLDKEFNIKLSDFGFARHLSYNNSDKIVLSKTFCGSAAYAAPEVLQGIPYDPKVYDIWSLGVILFIMVSGSMPYDDSNIKKMLRVQKQHCVNFPRSKHLSTDLRDIIYNMLQPDVRQRLTIDETLNHSWLKLLSKSKGSEFAPLSKKYVNPTDKASVFKHANPDTPTLQTPKEMQTDLEVASLRQRLLQQKEAMTATDTNTPAEEGTAV
ncbi:testis-specific serine/threonine-protein kinase 1-like [Hyla sarda]|uniref:testis-specific serine/threonine-protein kinase 1-like n=1 Tax=Hyla sarda TaxID=327740 RepID=UPI0024C441F9|nr:testis-specific serine/threonine-protein kinase 1-like [Hyla sarda]XP_056387688.1 testis-specific serine/threonine-protein kinase 1-like [Hyla sarda]XP_056387697.1 testis-specific serine/threonine-protein kinase 1-like [Hyla sarda]XP_056387705.1 testis-specific serine/threonine-protein kinase 1-like [Hyla sarda]XP_056387715.1 testis-specific serine/threonine-protein kinase 1-like [Hyla sarda]